jgi:hypothetical protein
MRGRVARALPACLLAWTGCMERTEYHYRPANVSMQMGRPVEEVFYKPDGTKVVISPHLRGSLTEEPQASSAASDDPSDSDESTPLQVHTPDMVLEVFMVGLRSEHYEEIWSRLVSPQQKARMGGERGLETFVAFCRDNRQELMASCLRLCSSIRNGQAVFAQPSQDMLRYQLPVTDRANFGFTLVEVERTREGLRLAGIR